MNGLASTGLKSLPIDARPREKLLARGPSAALSGEGVISDGVDQATQKNPTSFPYLADLNE